MTKARALGAWAFTLVLLAISAAQAWGLYSISADAGGGSLSVSGFAAFPVIGTLLALQVVTVLVSLLVGPLVIRLLAGALIPFMAWNVVDVFLNATSQIQLTVTQVLADQTGVIQDISSNQFLVESSSNLFSWGYLVASGLNILVLSLLVAVTLKPKVAKTVRKIDKLPEDLWSDQR